MLFTTRQLAVALALFGCAFCTTTADAGFVLSGLEADASASTLRADDSAGMQAPTGNEQEITKQQRLLLMILQQQAPTGLFAAPPAPTSSTGMGSVPSDAPGPSAGVALLTSPAPTTGELSVRLAQQREPYHPRFLKSRLFRPPRFLTQGK